MIPQDMMAALGGGGGAPAGGGGLPPDLLAALGGGGAPAPGGALHGGAAAEGNPEDFYREALDLLDQGMRADVDEGRIQAVLQVSAKIQGLLADSEKGMDSMASGKLDPAMMRRMSAGDQAY